MEKDQLLYMSKGKGEGAEVCSPLNLAYLGDAVFELLVRSMVLAEGHAPVNALHKKSRGYVNAAAQAAMYTKLLAVVDEEELAVLKRGRNAKSFTTAKNATVGDYRHATGVEALFGYLYLKERMERLIELFRICVDR